MAGDILNLQTLRRELTDSLEKALRESEANIVDGLLQKLGGIRAFQVFESSSPPSRQISRPHSIEPEHVQAEVTMESMVMGLPSARKESDPDDDAMRHVSSRSRAKRRTRSLGVVVRSSKQKRQLEEEDSLNGRFSRKRTNADADKEAQAARAAVRTGLPTDYLEIPDGDDIPEEGSLRLLVKEVGETHEPSSPASWKPSALREFCGRFVTSPRFINLSAAVIFANVMFIGIGIDYEARHWRHEEEPLVFKVVNLGFFVLFTVEIALRMVAEGLRFFCGVQNMFDFFLVLIQMTEVTEDWKLTSAGSGKEFILLRILRVLRMGRILRLTRAMHLFDELSNLLDSIGKSLQSLVWVLIMITFITYGVGVILTHVVTEYKTSAQDLDAKTEADLERLYGTVDRSMLVLYEVISQGVAWGRVMTPLTTHITPWISFVFVGYTAFVFFAMMNVVTSFFVDNTIRSVEASRNTKMALQLWAMFKQEDGGPLTGITSEVFKDYLDTPQMAAYLASLDLTAEDTETYGFFDLLDADGSGEIDADELVRGCLRLRGHAKQVDLAALMCMHRENMNHIYTVLEDVQAAVRKEPASPATPATLLYPRAVS
eukprot:TRINITY_DN36631_c0_g3_i1.p1 TRINITY_DN36631_c0_g3~~TRINITY_DN36631_c0_g3_i1.p1  ORF type:complete len:600 (-),score=116.10 TRINITY_DN36631_c0_g3_i1:388-2187(-)